MKDASLYKTKQRDLLLDCIKSSGDAHLTVDGISTMLKNSDTPVGKTTIYRYLKILTDNGIVRKYSSDGDSACYQYVKGHNECAMHYHLKCDECGKLIHAGNELMRNLADIAEKDYGFVVDGVKTVIYGRCVECGG